MNALKPINCRCGEPARLIIDGRGLCEKHRASWLVEERVDRVMAALDKVLDEPIDEWNNYLRKLAIVAIGAM